jgi:apolipoprotein N-acyltransferase
MRWITSPGWPGNLLAVVAGALTTLALAPFDIWPLALVALALFYLGLRDLSPRQALGRGWCFGLACLARAPAGSTTAFTTSAARQSCWPAC